MKKTKKVVGKTDNSKKTVEKRKEIAKCIGLVGKQFDEPDRAKIRQEIIDKFMEMDLKSIKKCNYNHFTCSSDRCMTTAENLAMAEARVCWLAKELVHALAEQK